MRVCTCLNRGFKELEDLLSSSLPFVFSFMAPKKRATSKQPDAKASAPPAPGVAWSVATHVGVLNSVHLKACGAIECGSLYGSGSSMLSMCSV